LIRAVVLFLLMLPQAHGLGADFYVVDVSPDTVSPGQTTVLNITLKNLGDEPASYLRAFLDPEDVTPISAIGPAKKYLSRADRAVLSSEYFGLIIQTMEILLQYQVHVDRDAESKTYYVPLKLAWRNTVMGEETQTLNIGIAVVGRPDLVIGGVSTYPSRIYPDEDFNLSVKLENIGTGKAEAVSLKLLIPPEIRGETAGFLGTINRDAASTAVFDLKTLKSASPGAYTLTLVITYKEETGLVRSVEEVFDIYVGERGEVDIEIAGITTSPSKLYPGESFSLSVQLENIGRQDAKSVRAEIDPGKEFVGERISFVGSLKEDDLSTAIFEMEVPEDTRPGSYELGMKIVYVDEQGTEHVEEKAFSLLVSEKPRNRLRDAAVGGSVALLLLGAYFWMSRSRKR
jgi:hypothetical protein